jgi:hypothetical protein
MNNSKGTQNQTKDCGEKYKAKEVENDKDTTQPAKEWIVPADPPP